MALFSYNINMTTYKILYDITQDAYNWFSAINNFHQEKKLHNVADRQIAQKIRGLSFDEAKQILIPFLQERNQKIEMSPHKFQQIMSTQLRKDFDVAIQKLESVTGHPIALADCAKNRAKEIAKIDTSAVAPMEDLLLLLTTFPAMIVYYEEGTIFTFAKIDQKLWGMPLDGILHELMHFQTNYYYRQNPDSPVSRLSDHDYYVFKESLTALLDETWKPIITLPDCSYPEFQVLRDKLRNYYHKTKDFDKLMKFGAEEVAKYE